MLSFEIFGILVSCEDENNKTTDNLNTYKHRVKEHFSQKKKWGEEYT